jgi:hypothetical protein
MVEGLEKEPYRLYVAGSEAVKYEYYIFIYQLSLGVRLLSGHWQDVETWPISSILAAFQASTWSVDIETPFV